MGFFTAFFPTTTTKLVHPSFLASESDSFVYNHDWNAQKIRNNQGHVLRVVARGAFALHLTLRSANGQLHRHALYVLPEQYSPLYRP